MWVKILLIFFVFSFIFKTDHSFDQDLGRHLKLGEIIVKTGQVPRTNLFSYTNPDFPFINTHWLFGVWAYLTSQALGLYSLLILKIIIFLTSIWLILKIIPSEKSILLLPIGFIFFHVLRERTELRPEIFSFLFTALTYFILDKNIKNPTKLIFLLPFIQLIWINTHIYFFIGLILQVIFIIQLVYQKLRSHIGSGKVEVVGIVFILSALISIINPNGLTGALYPLNVTKNYGYTIVENQTMFLLESINFRNPNFIFVKISLVITALSLIYMLFKKRFDVRNILIAGFGAGLALLNVRSFPYLVFLTLPAVLQNFGPLKNIWITKLITIGAGILLITESFLYLNGSYYLKKDDNKIPELKFTQSGKEALDFVIKEKLPNPVFNNFDIGSYIIYRGYPNLKVFVDGRPEAYPQKFFSEEYIPSQSDYLKFSNLQNKHGFKTIIFSHTDQTPWGKNFLTSVVKDEEWKIVYIDDFMIVLVKSETTQSMNLKTIELKQLKADDFKFDSFRSYLNLGIFLLGTSNTDAGVSFITKALQLNPKSPTANMLLGNFQMLPGF